MARRALLGLFLFFLWGCPHAHLDAGLVARVPSVEPEPAAGGELRFLEYAVAAVTPPAVEEWPHPVAEGLTERGLRYRFTLRGPDGGLDVMCQVGGQHGSLMTEPYASVECRSGDITVLMSGYGTTDFLGLRIANGTATVPDPPPPAPGSSVTFYLTDRLRIEGSGRLWNFIMSQESHRRGADGQWRGDCCQDGRAVAAVALRPPRVLLDPRLTGRLRAAAALGVAALLALRDVARLDGVP